MIHCDNASEGVAKWQTTATDGERERKKIKN